MTDNLETMSVEIDGAKRRIFFCHRGVWDKDCAIRSFHIINEAEGFDSEYDTLGDFRLTTEVRLGVDELKEVLTEARAIDKRTGKGALVVGDGLGRIAFASLSCTLADAFASLSIRLKAFNTMEEAETWLDSK